MKAVILAGGLGTRISEETSTRPKPMIEVGGKPLLWHIIKHYSHYGINDFIICCGYKADVIKHYFYHYYLLMSDVTFDMKRNSTTYHQSIAEPWRITLVDTGEQTMTGGRLKRIYDYVKDDEMFCLTYGDGLSDVNLAEAIAFHKRHGKLATVTAVQNIGRFGLMDIQGESVQAFQEKPHGQGGHVNAGFFVLSPRALELVEDDQTIWEKAPLESLAYNNELNAYMHNGFWHCIDTLRDKQMAEQLWESGQAPWKIWD